MRTEKTKKNLIYKPYDVLSCDALHFSDEE